MSRYQTLIADIVRTGNLGTYDPRHIEAFMRCAMNGTLDHLSPRRFREEVGAAAVEIDEAGPEMSEKLAKSYGL